MTHPEAATPSDGWAVGPFYFTDALHYIESLLGFAEPRCKTDEQALDEASLYLLEARAFLERTSPAKSNAGSPSEASAFTPAMDEPNV